MLVLDGHSDTPAGGVGRGLRRRLPEPRLASPAARGDRLADGAERLHRRARGLRVPRGRGDRGRRDHADPDGAGGALRPVRRDPRRPLLAPARAARERRPPGAADGGGGRRGARGLAVRGGLRDRRHLADGRHVVPAGTGCAAAEARADAGGADCRQRRREHDRERRHLRRPGPRRHPAGAALPRRYLRRHGRHVRLVGAADRADRPRRAAVAVPGGACGRVDDRLRRLPHDRRRAEGAPDRPPLLRADGRGGGGERARRRRGARPARPRQRRRRLPQLGRRRRRHRRRGRRARALGSPEARGRLRARRRAVRAAARPRSAPGRRRRSRSSRSGCSASETR